MVDSIDEELPKILAKKPKLLKLIEQRKLCRVSLDYSSQFDEGQKPGLHAVGIDDALGFTDPEKLRYVEVMNSIREASCLEFFMIEGIQNLKAKFAYEKLCPTFVEYMSKGGKLV